MDETALAGETVVFEVLKGGAVVVKRAGSNGKPDLLRGIVRCRVLEAGVVAVIQDGDVWLHGQPRP
jgi:hypothetical protein